MTNETLDLPTPYLAVDLDILEANVQAMAATAASRGVSLRPHVKTHKCLEIASRQRGAGAVGITVATVSEAEIFVEAGYEDLFIAYPLWVDKPRGARLSELMERCSLRIGVDSLEGAQALARNISKAGDLEVLIEVDCGHHRTGVPPKTAGSLAIATARAGLSVRGVFTYPGHSYGPGAGERAVADEARALSQAASSIRAFGVECDVLSGGSTPTAALGSTGPLTEMRPGVYVFNDAQQLELGTCSTDALALSAAATVVSRRPGRLVLDAGGKVLGADRPPWATGYGRIAKCPRARLSALSEHHATVEWPESSVLPELGSTVAVTPNHCCAAVNLADELVVFSGGELIASWQVVARGANT